MRINCPSCGAQIEQHRQPAKNDPSAGDAWVCFKCTNIVCVNCYIQHNENAHSEVYEPQKRPTSGNKKNQKKKKR